MEIQRSFKVDSSIPKSNDGLQHIELDSGCPGGKKGANLTLYQDIRTRQGASYRISFDLRNRQHNRDSSIEVSFGDQLLMSGPVENGSWKTYSFVVETDQDITRLRFEETGIADNYGSLVDNVSVFLANTN